MKHPKNFANNLLVIEGLSNAILRKIDDCENKIKDNFSIKRDFYNIDYVYMHSIVLDMAKLISVTNSDKSGLRQLKSESPTVFRKRIEKFEKRYHKTIEKITSNRNRIISHVNISDINSYFNMGFSDIEISKKIEDYKKILEHYGGIYKPDLQLITDLEKFKSADIKDERYSPSDFSKDTDNFRAMVREILFIVRDLNIHFYNLEK